MTPNPATMEALGKVPLFSDLTREELGKIANLFQLRRFDRGRTIVKEGRGGDVFFVIQSGLAMVTIDGQEHASLSTGDYFGEIALYDRGFRTATITAEDDLVCHGLAYSDFRTLVEDNGVIGWKLLQRMTRLFREIGQK